MGAMKTALIHPDGENQAIPIHSDPNMVDLEGPTDPANPQNWSKRVRVGHVALISIITLIA